MLVMGKATRGLITYNRQDNIFQYHCFYMESNFIGFLLDGFSVTTSLWWGPFHAITSFNNAGFALHSEGFSAFRGSPFLLAISGFLAFCGNSTKVKKPQLNLN